MLLQVTENVERLQLFKVDVNSRLEAAKQLRCFVQRSLQLQCCITWTYIATVLVVVCRMQEGQAVRRELGMKVNHDAFQQMNGDAGSRVGEMEGKLAQVCGVSIDCVAIVVRH